MSDFIEDLTKSLLLPQCKVLKLPRQKGEVQLFNLYNENNELLLASKNFTETTDYIVNVLWKPIERDTNGQT